MFGKRLAELLAMTMIGEGVLALLYPRCHARLWCVGPRSMRQLVEWCAEHPDLTRCLGVLEAGAGIWLAVGQYPRGGPGDTPPPADRSFAGIGS